MRSRIAAAAVCLSCGLAVRGECRVEPVQRTANAVRVVVDPRIELMSIAQHIGEFRTRYPFLLTKDASRYRDEVDEAFQGYRTHEAVTLVSNSAAAP